MSWFKLCVSGLLCCVFLQSADARSQASDTPKNQTVERYEQAVALHKAGQTDEALKLLNGVIKADRRYAPAYNKTGEILMRMGTPRARIKAEEMFEQALRLDRNNRTYRMNLARLRLAQGVDLAAFREFRKVLDQYEDDPEALYETGMYHMREMNKYMDTWDKYMDRTGMVMWDGTELWNSITAGEAEKSRQAFERILLHSPKHHDANMRLAELAYYDDEYREMLPYLNTVLDGNGKDIDALCLKGVASVRMKQYPEAQKVFNAALTDMAPELRRVYESSGLLTETIMDIEDRVTAVQKFDPDFWKAVDPMYLTSYNERLLEHYSRVTEANLRFAVPDNKHSTGGKSLPGWKTDRGYVFIKYGKPYVHMKDTYEYRGRQHTGSTKAPPWSASYTPVPTTKMTGGYTDDFGQPQTGAPMVIDGLYIDWRDREYWSYPGIGFKFHDPYGSGNSEFGPTRPLDFDYRTSEEPDAKYSMQVQMDNMPEMYLPEEFQGKTYVLPVATCQFRGDGGKTEMLVSYGLPSSKLRFEPVSDGYKAKFLRGFFLFDEEWQPLSNEVEEMSASSGPEFQVTPGQIFPTHRSMQVNPGFYNLAIEVVEKQDRNMGLAHYPLAVRDFSRDSLQISDILLAEKIVPPADRAPVRREDFRMTPNIRRTYDVFHPAYLYYEVYNLKCDPATGRSRYQVEYSLELERGVRDETWKDLAALSGDPGVIRSTALYESSERDALQYLTLNLGNARPGVYTVRLRVTDLIAQTVAEQFSRVGVAPLTPREYGPPELNPDALRDGLQALKLNPENLMTRYHLGVVYYNAGKPKEAIKHYQSALDAGSDAADVHYALALALRDEGRLTEALAHAEQARGSKTDLPAYRILSGNLLATLGRYEEALDILKPGADEWNSQLQHAFARACDFPGGARVATEHYDRSSMSSLEYAPAQHELGRSLLRMNKTDNARIWLQLAGALDPHYRADYRANRQKTAGGDKPAEQYTIPWFMDTQIAGKDGNKTQCYVRFVATAPGTTTGGQAQVQARLQLFDARWRESQAWSLERALQDGSGDAVRWFEGEFAVTTAPGRYFLVLSVDEEQSGDYGYQVREILIPEMSEAGMTLLPPVVGKKDDGRAFPWYSTTDTLTALLPKPLTALPDTARIRWKVRKFFRANDPDFGVIMSLVYKAVLKLGADNRITKFRGESTAFASEQHIGSVDIPLTWYRPGAYLVSAEILDAQDHVIGTTARAFSVGRIEEHLTDAPEILSLKE